MLNWNSRCITLKDQGQAFGYVVLMKSHSRPAIGGVRILNNPISRSALPLCIDLAGTMERKAFFCDLPLGGAKSVICLDEPKKKKKYLRLFADALNQLSGQYITAVDIGSSQCDMDYLSQFTPYLTCHTEGGGDPSVYTAQTVLISMETAYKILFPEKSLNQSCIVVQGIGKLGFSLLEKIQQRYPGAEMVVADVRQDFAREFAKKHHVRYEHSDDIYSVSCDVFISAAGSLLIDSEKAACLQCQLFVSAANNPFVSSSVEHFLKNRGVVVLPDYVVNGGGLIACACQYGFIDDIHAQLDKFQARFKGSLRA